MLIAISWSAREPTALQGNISQLFSPQNYLLKVDLSGFTVEEGFSCTKRHK